MPRSEPEGPGTWWQMPQGGIDADEEPQQAALRELVEETGIRSVALIAESPNWYAYDLPEPCDPRRGMDAIAASGRSGLPCAFWAARTRSPLRDRPDNNIEFDAWRWAEARRTGAPDRALQAGSLHRRCCRDFRARCWAGGGLSLAPSICRVTKACKSRNSQIKLVLAWTWLDPLGQQIEHRPALPPLRRDHADQPQWAGVGRAAPAQVGGRSLRTHLADAARWDSAPASRSAPRPCASSRRRPRSTRVDDHCRGAGLAQL